MKHLHRYQDILCAFLKTKRIFVFALLITLSVCCFAPQAQAGPAPIQTFFVPLPELQVQTSLKAVDTDDQIEDVMRSIISIAATGDNTIITYDHWEDGYEADLANPVQASTEIWGDNNAGNGIPPGFGTDVINAGDVISLDNTVSLPRNPGQILYDGRDKFGGTKAVAVTRASWAVDPGVVLAGAVEVYPLRDYGLRFEVPVGEDLSSDDMFEYVSLMVLAAQDGTDIQIDVDGDGTTDITQTLNQGESYQVDGGIDTGASVTASRPVQAHIITGDIGARYESRFYTLYPVENWSDSYYSPVGTAADDDETYVFVYNPNGSAITVDYETRVGSGSFAVPAGSAYRYLMPSQSGAHFSTSDGSPFFAIATVGADPGANLVHDWGFSLLPESYLTPMALVGWGPGSNDLSENGSPVWVTAAAAATVYVDYDGDPATGPLVDANGDRYDVALNLALLESARVYDNSDNDQTGMRLYTLDGTLITAAWGQDPANSAGGAPYLDLGTSVLPFPIASVEKASALVVDNNSNGLVDWGDTVEYTITVNNDGVVVLGGVVALDLFPAGVTYVTGSTTLTGAPLADETVPPAVTAYPLDEGGLTMPVIVPTGFSTITFRVIVDVGTTIINNSVSINTDQEVLTTNDTVNVNTPDVTDCSLAFTDAGGVSQATYPENSDIYVTVDDNDRNTDAGSAQSFTVVVENLDTGDVETITLAETGNDSGVFRNTAALPSSITGGMSDEDGTLHAVAGNTLQVADTDPVFGDTCSDTAGISIPTLIKPLYLSEPGQSMDRVDPVYTGDGTTATSVELSFSGSGTTGMAVWSATGTPEYNNWDGSSFGTTQNAAAQTLRWRTMAGAAAPARDEKIVVGIESGNSISGELWNGSSWSTSNLTALDSVSESYWYGADVAYEQQSGDAVLVWNGGTTSSGQLRYKVWNGSTWTAAASIAAYAGGEPQNMHMAAKPGADEMVLVVNDINADDYTLVWNGSTWGNALSLDTSGTAENDQSALYVAYEQQSGRAMVLYGKDGDANGYYRIWNGSSWEPGEGSITAPAGVSSQIGWIRLASDPSSNRIVIGVLTTGGTAADIWLNVWDGSSWGTSLQAETSATDSIFPNVAVAFESQSGEALAAYGESAQNLVRYRTWSSAGGWSGEQTDGPNIGAVPNSLVLDSDPLSNDIMLAVQDSTSHLNYVLWNGSSWETADELETNTQETKNQPFVFLYDQHIVPAGSSTTFSQLPVMCKDFVMPVGGAVTVTNYISVVPSSGSVTRSIAAGSDDAEEEGSDADTPGFMYWDSSDLELVEDFQAPDSGTQQVGMRFNNITVPPGATITNAYITFRADTPEAPNTNNGATSLTIEGQAADNPGTFTSTAYNISNRTPTAASAGWSPSAWTTGSDYNTPDLKSIAQELVNRSGWAGGNSMVFIVTGTGSRAAESWDSAGSNPPQLTIEYTTNSMPATPDISATIKHDGTTIETLTDPAVTDLGSGIYKLDWTAVISSDTTVLAGEQVELEITTAEAGASFEILYDSSTYPSKILLPTTTVIVIHVDTLAAYDAPYPGGSAITDAENGAVLYPRVTVSDPFGAYDITDLDLSISDPCGGGPINVTLNDGDVVATGACSKTYQYIWNTTMCQGNYDIVAVANEGTEGITDSAAIRVTLSFTDTGTAGSTAFTDGAGNPVSNYNADATICTQVIDMDQNSNPAVAETVSAVVTSPQGDSESITLTETGPNTGIFRACIASSSTVPGAPDDGSLYALPGDVLVARYSDPDDPGDISDDTALVNTPAADMTLSKLLADPFDGTAVVNDLIRFDIVVGSPGPTDLTSFTVTDTFDAACLSYDAASITPDSIGAGTITWDETELGTLPVGSTATISVWFTADSACAPTVNSVLAGGQDEFGTAVSAGPATAQVTITDPALSVIKTLISPNPGPAYVGDPVTFRITLENTGTSVITTLPLADTFSAACYTYQSATVAPDGIGAGSLLWDNLGPLATSASTSLDLILTVTGECNPAQNTADVGFAVDVNGDSVPAVQDSAGLQTIGAKIGDTVWNDRDGDGIQDVGEGGMANVVVYIDSNDDGDRDVGEPYDTTDASGAYDVTDLAAGSYFVKVDATTLPAGALLTTGNNPLAVTVAAGEDVNTADFGYQGNAAIGDFIWHDSDGDGSQDGGEPGLGSVTVFLDADGDGVLDAGEPFTVTDGGGNYDFTSLVAGDYIVDVDDTTLPPNYVLTTDAATLSVALAAGQDHNDADFGYRQQGGVNGHLFEDVDGDGVQDTGEADLTGIDVIITDSNGDPQTVTTDANGDYQAFLPPGATTLDVVDTTLPPNAFITTANDPQTVTVNAGVFIDSSDVGYQFGIPSRMKLRTGFYTGNAIAGTPITGLGFEPDLVIIKAADDTKEAAMRSSSMAGDVSKPMGGATALTAGLIQSLDADGFTIGADDRVNKDTVTYHWIAFEAGDGEMTVDSYTGTGADNTSVSGVGFQPDYVMVLPAINEEPVHRSSAQTGDTTMLFKNTASVTNHIQALGADGFQLGDDDRVNKLNETYHYIAWKEVAGKTAVGSYDGNDTDYTDIDGLGFEPEYVIIKQDDTKEAVHRPDSLSGDNTLWFAPQSASADMIQELQSDGFQIGLDDNVNASTETYFWAAFAGSHLTISSAADQAFFVADPATVIQTITITEDNLDPTITAANDIRIRIPAGFNMTWDTALTTASIGGMAAAKVSTAVTYEDGGRTLVLDVTSDFVASDQITVSLLRFNNFTAGSPADNLELEVDGAGTLAAVDDKTIAIAAPTISSAANQTFSVGDPARDIRTITITEDSVSPTITAGDDIRILIPDGFNMTWDTLDLTAIIGGSAAGKVSTTVSYEDGGRTLVLDVTSDFAAADQITISGLSFENFSAISAADNLELEVKNNGVVQNTDDKTIAIADLSISSAENQEFIVGDSATGASTITVTDGTTAALITAANDIRIKIPSDLYMLWDTSDLNAVIGGSAASKVLSGVSYEDNGKTLVLNVTSDFVAGDQITISGLSFSDFSAASYGDRLELEVFNDGVTAAEDDKWKAIGGSPSLSGSMLVYGEGNVITPRYRNWQGAPSLSFSAEASANNTDDVIKWVVLKPSPIENEMVLATYSSVDMNLYVQTWDGTSWTSNWNTHLNYDGSTRMFDIAYEKESGDVIVVFGDNNDDTLKYRKRVDGTWDSADQTIGVMTPDSQINWVRAEARPGSDDIFVAAVSSSKSLYALRWDGSADTWGDQIQTTAGVFNAGREGFDIAFESASGDAFLVWGDAAKNVKYREFTTSWQAETTAYATLPDDVQWLAAAYDPQSNSSEIAIAMVLDNNTFEFGAWDGSSWVGRPAAIVAPNKDNRFIDVAFESDTGEAVYGFTQNVAADDKKKFAWRTWTSAAGFGSVTVEDGLSDEIKFVQLKADPHTDDIMAVYADKAKDLYHRFWDGSSWTALAAPLETVISDESQQEAFMFAWKESPPTAIDLITFTARGQDAAVQVAWQTGHEINNLGFNLYRSSSFAGPYTQINSSLISGLAYSVMGKSYSFADGNVTPGQLYYYRLEDIDVDGTRTFHGPICVDWDGDGMPDDWEIAYGLNPGADDANLDPDNDGLTNIEEYQLGTDPFNPDSDGDGIPDGAEDRKIDRAAPISTRALTRGVEILAADETGITLELRTEAFETELVNVGGQEFERLQIPDYIHGYTQQTGQPRLPLKGILIDIPAGRSAALTVLETEDELYEGYQVYPVAENVVDAQDDVAGVVEHFAWDQAAYAQDLFYPNTVAELGRLFTFRGQGKQQVMLYPLNFNPATGQIWLHRRIRLRVEFGDDPLPVADRTTPAPWQPPSGANPTGVLDLTMANLRFSLYPFAPMLLALDLLTQPAWAVGAGLPFETTAYKIMVSEEGIYRLSRSYLAGGGLDVDGIDLSRVRLYHLGQELAIHVHDPNGDHHLDDGDFIEFYGQAVPARYAKYAAENVYWLVTAGGSDPPRRMPTVDGTPAGAAVAGSHRRTVRHEQDAYYVGSAPGADDVDRWYFADFVLGTDFTGTPSPVPVDFTLALPGMAGPADLKIRLWGYYDTAHEVTVRVNGTAAGTYHWSGIAFKEIAIEGLSLVDGNNTVTLACHTALDGVLVDWFEVAYARSFTAVDNTLTFSHDSGYRYTVTGFSTNEHRVYDITDPTDVRRVVNFTSAAAPTNTLTFEPPDSGQTHTYLTLTPDAVKTPPAIVEDRPSDLGDGSNGADYILITHRDLGWDLSGNPQAWLTDLRVLREGQGLRVKVVDVADIFDEFGHGLPTPAAIRDFLSYAYDNWSPPAPKYVLLVGDTTYDYKDNFGRGTVNYVPSYLVFTEYMGETVTDEWYARISGDDAVPDLYIGRLTAAGVADAAVMVDKIQTYENAANTKTWQKNVVLIADDRTEDYEAIFETISEEVADLLPAGMNPAFKGYLNDYPVASDLTADITSQIDAGALLVNYSGHASLQRWAAEGIFQNSDVAQLTNAEMYPFVVNMSCLTGYFAYLDAYMGADLSLAEALLRAEGRGAVAALMPTGMTPPEGQQILAAALAETVFTEDVRRLGPAIAAAKQTLLANGAGAYEELSETFLLFGDPALELKVPLPRRPAGLTAEGRLSDILLQWQPAADCNGEPVAGYHLYRSHTPTGDYTRVNSELITETQYADPAVETAVAGRPLLNLDTPYYYTLTAVAVDGDQSVESEMVSAALLPATPDDDAGSGSDEEVASGPDEEVTSGPDEEVTSGQNEDPGSDQDADEASDQSGGGGGGGCFICFLRNF